MTDTTIERRPRYWATRVWLAIGNAIALVLVLSAFIAELVDVLRWSLPTWERYALVALGIVLALAGAVIAVRVWWRNRQPGFRPHTDRVPSALRVVGGLIALLLLPLTLPVVAGFMALWTPLAVVAPPQERRARLELAQR